MRNGELTGSSAEERRKNGLMLNPIKNEMKD
jgi:hypothetical protein